MKFSLMRRIDFYVGFFLCEFLALIFKIRGRNKDLPPLPQSLNNKKILIMKFLGFGSILMATPLMRELKRNYPSCEIHLITFEGNVPVCQSIPLIDKTLYLEKKSAWKFLSSLIKNLSLIRKEHYEMVFNLEFFSNFSLLLSALSKSPHVVCFGGRHEYRKTLCQHIVSYENKVHVADKFFNFIKILISSPSGDSNKLGDLQEAPETQKRIVSLLKKHHLNPDQDFLVVVNINASEMSGIRKWPLEFYEEVISFLVKKRKVKIILIGAKDDIPYVTSLKKRFPENEEVVNLAGQISLKELISLMKKSHLYLGNDSGPLHLAEACGLPHISFFGPESPDVYGHPGKNNTIFYSNLPCSPCLNVYTNKDTRCQNNLCLKRITPDQVIKILQEKYLSE